MTSHRSIFISQLDFFLVQYIIINFLSFCDLPSLDLLKPPLFTIVMFGHKSLYNDYVGTKYGSTK